MISIPMVVTIGIALVLAGFLQGRQSLDLRWEPNRHTLAAIAAGLLPALLSTFCLLLPQSSWGYQLVLFLGIFGCCGYFVPGISSNSIRLEAS